jgi:hypothetical protein
MHMTHNLDIFENENEKLAIGGKEGINIFNFDIKTNKWNNAEHLSNTPTGEIKLGFEVSKFFPTIVSPMHGNKLISFDENNKETILTENMNQAHALAFADFLGNGSQQIAVGWREPNRDKKVGIKIFSQNNQTKTWEEFTIDDNKMACEDMQVADLNGDGKMDIIASGRATKNLVIYWNRN